MTADPVEIRNRIFHARSHPVNAIIRPPAEFPSAPFCGREIKLGYHEEHEGHEGKTEIGKTESKKANRESRKQKTEITKNGRATETGRVAGENMPSRKNKLWI
jgi:hypothetical protein